MDAFNQMNTRAATFEMVNAYMRKVYLWMAIGLGVTGCVAWWVSNTPSLLQMIFGNSWVVFALIIAQFGLVIALSAAIHKMSPAAATGCFLLYSALTGATLSSIFLVYASETITSAFFVAAGTFCAMAAYGLITKRDLSKFGTFLIMGLFGLIIAMLVNMFVHSSAMGFVINCVGVLVFAGLTAVDNQKLRNFGANAPLDDSVAMQRGSILGALTLYLDFINLFLMLLQLFGGSRD